MYDKTAELSYDLIKATKTNELCDIALVFAELVLAVQEEFGFEFPELQCCGRSVSVNKLKPAICFFSRALISALELDNRHDMRETVRVLIQELHGVLNFSTLFLKVEKRQELTSDYISEGFFIGRQGEST